jgi:membrane-associated phospholipid phosphatase
MMDFVAALPPHLLYVLGVAISASVALCIGARVYLPAGERRRRVSELLRSDWKYLGMAWGVTAAINQLARYRVDQPFTQTVYEIEGATVAVFQTVTTAQLTLILSAVYLVGFPFIVLFTYFKLKAHEPEQARRYAIAYVSLVLISAPFFLLLPVRVSGHVLADVEPLLYESHTIIQAGVMATDTLMKALPSLHTGLSVLAAIYAWKTDRAYAWTATILTATIVFSTFYLGIHWLSDAIIAVVLVVFVYWVSQSVERTQWRQST